MEADEGGYTSNWGPDGNSDGGSRGEDDELVEDALQSGWVGGHGRQRCVTSDASPGSASGEEATRAGGNGYDVASDAVPLIQSYTQVRPYPSSVCSAFSDVLNFHPLSPSSLPPPFSVPSSCLATTLLNSVDKR